MVAASNCIAGGLTFRDSITLPKVIKSTLTSKLPSGFTDQEKLVTLPKKAS